MKKQILDECSFDFLDKKAFKTRSYNYSINCLYRIENDINNFFYIINSPIMYELGRVASEYTEDMIVNYLKTAFKRLNFNHKNKVLLVGLGNPRLSADSLGEKVFSKVLKTGDILSKYNNLCFVQGIAPNIYANTGIKTDKIIKAIIKEEKPQLVIIVDSLATNNLDRLAKSFQLTNTSMQPGGAMNKFNKVLTKENLGVKTLFIGVPLMYKHLTEDGDETLLSPKDIDYEVKNCSLILANALNRVLFPNLKKSEIEDLVF